MNKRNALNLGLLVAVVALGLVVWLDPGHKAPPPPPKLTGLTPAQVQTIRIERRTGKTIELRKVDGHWRMEAPIKVAANDWRVQSLLRVAQNRSLGANPVSGPDLAKYGLDKPAARLFLDRTEIDFGDTTPFKDRRYVRIGKIVHVIPDVAYYHLVGRYTGFVSPQPLPPQARIDKLELPKLTLTLDHNGNWQPQPKPAHYSADALTHLADAWRYASALNVTPYTAGKAKGAGGNERVSVHLAGRQAPVVFLIVARKPELLLARPDLGIEYHLPKNEAKAMFSLTAAPAGKEAPAPAK